MEKYLPLIITKYTTITIVTQELKKNVINSYLGNLLLSEIMTRSLFKVPRPKFLPIQRFLSMQCSVNRFQSQNQRIVVLLLKICYINLQWAGSTDSLGNSAPANPTSELKGKPLNMFKESIYFQKARLRTST